MLILLRNVTLAGLIAGLLAIAAIGMLTERTVCPSQWQDQISGMKECE